MRVNTERIVSILLLLGVLALPALAMLPTSSYMHGSAFYGVNDDDPEFLKGRVDYAVYDTDNLSLADEQDFVDALGLAGQYVYAYQIWNDYSVSESAVKSFEVMYQDGSSVAAAILNDTGAHDDGEGGVAPSSITSQGVWQWSIDTDFLAIGEHSYFLIFSSDAAPISGKFEVNGPVNEGPVPPTTPEPATVALVGLGSMVVFGRRRKSKGV
jgi:hypothetical protein